VSLPEEGAHLLAIIEQGIHSLTAS
jgi:hypothetical protein